MTIYLSLLVCLVGLVVFAISKNPDVKELGKLSYFAGLLAFLIRFGPEALRLP